MNKGKYILIEGGDGSGKSVQIKLLGKYLEKKNIPYVDIHEPGGTEISEILEGIVKDKKKEILSKQAELFIFLAARSQVTLHIVKPHLERGEWVISDRGYPSTVAYQGYGRGIDLEIIDMLNKFSITHDHDNEIIFPDLIFVIDVAAEFGLKKARESSKTLDRIEAESLNFHTRVNEGYKKFLKMYPNISIRIPYIENNSQEMHSLIVKNLEERFGI